MKAYRWNYGKKDYEETEIPSGSTTFQFDMEKIVSCASCGKEMRFGDGYMSKVIRTEWEWGYGICKNCAIKERNDARHYGYPERN